MIWYMIWFTRITGQHNHYNTLHQYIISPHYFSNIILLVGDWDITFEAVNFISFRIHIIFLFLDRTLIYESKVPLLVVHIEVVWYEILNLRPSYCLDSVTSSNSNSISDYRQCKIVDLNWNWTELNWFELIWIDLNWIELVYTVLRYRLYLHSF